MVIVCLRVPHSLVTQGMLPVNRAGGRCDILLVVYFVSVSVSYDQEMLLYSSL